MFLFKKSNQIEVFKWSLKNRAFMLLNEKGLAIGVGYISN